MVPRNAFKYIFQTLFTPGHLLMYHKFAQYCLRGIPSIFQSRNFLLLFVLCYPVADAYTALGEIFWRFNQYRFITPDYNNMKCNIISVEYHFRRPHRCEHDEH